LLVELLGAHSAMPVVEATDSLAVKENCVFVIPPDATLTIKDGVLQLAIPAPAREHRRPIDTFFASLAEDCGERAVAIVLAGVGSDGTIGIRKIKEHGGLTLAQAEFDATALQGMPSSAVATGLVDHVMPVEAMAAKLIDYHKHLLEVAQKKDGDGHRGDLQEHLAKITSLLHARSAHDFSGYKEATLIRRLQRRMQVLHLENAPDYIERLKSDQGEVEALFREFLIGVTQFFRDREAFDALKASAIMPLLEREGRALPHAVLRPVARARRALVRQGGRRLLPGARDPRHVRVLHPQPGQRPAVLEARSDLLSQPHDLPRGGAAGPADAHLPLRSAARRLPVPRKSRKRSAQL
jgi:two-component system CheB/CheR fusion protein